MKIKFYDEIIDVIFIRKRKKAKKLFETRLCFYLGNGYFLTWKCKNKRYYFWLPDVAKKLDLE